MLYNLLTSYSDTYSFLNFFNFLTVRTGLAVITAMLIVFVIGEIIFICVPGVYLPCLFKVVSVT